MTDLPRIPPQRARMALSTSLRAMADAIDAGECIWVAAICLYTPEGAEKNGHAFTQCSGFPQGDSRQFWIMALGATRSASLDFEMQLAEVGAGSVDDVNAYTT